MSQYDPEFIGPIRAPEYLPLEFQIMFIRSVLKNWMQPEEEHFANKFGRNQGWIQVTEKVLLSQAICEMQLELNDTSLANLVNDNLVFFRS